MSDTFATGKTFVTGEQVTATDLNNAVNQAVPKVPLTDDQSITIVNNKIAVKDGDSTNGVPLTKMKHIIGHSVIGNIGSATAAPTNIEVAANEAVLGNSAGNGLITDKIDTDNIKDDAITKGKTDFIGDTTATMTLTGTAPRLILDDSGNSGTSPEVNGNSVDGNLSILAEKSGAEISIDADDEVILKHNGTEGLKVAADAGKNEAGTDVAGAKVTGGLYVTGDVYADDQVVADHLKLIGTNPNISFDQDDQGTPNSYITGNSTVNTIETRVSRAQGDIVNTAVDNFNVKVCDDPTADFDSTTNPYVERFRVAHDAGKDSSGNASDGAKVSGDLQVTGDINCAGGFNDIVLKSGSPKLTFEETDVTISDPFIQSFNSGNIEIKTEEANSLIRLDGKKGLVVEYDGSNTLMEANATAATDAGGNANQSGVKITGDLQVTGEGNIGKTKLGADSLLASSPSTSDDSAKIASTAFVNNLLDTFSATAPSGDGMSNSGSVTLPGGLILKFGVNVTSNSDDDQVFTFPSAFPNNHFVTITNNAKSGGTGVFPVIARTNSTFTVNRENSLNNPQSFDFISIGN